MADSSVVKRHIACPCGKSSDAYCLYNDGHGFCFSCNEHFKNNSTTKTPTEGLNNTVINKTITPPHYPNSVFGPISDRNITEETCKKFGVELLRDNNGKIIHHIYKYFDRNSQHVANKIRTVEHKGFRTEGNFPTSVLFGQNLFNQAGSYITVVEGELDALAAYQMTGSRWPVVSVKSASSALTDCKRSLQYLSQFEKVVLCFDNDTAGKKAADTVATLFPPSVAEIVTLSKYKDPSDYLKNNDFKSFEKDWWNKKNYTPEGIVCLSDMWKLIIEKDDTVSVNYPWEGLNSMTYGMRLGELCTYTGGSGQGKSSMVREIVYDIINKTNYNIGMMFLEETPKRTALALCGIHLNKPVHLPDTEYTDEELESAFSSLSTGRRLFFLDHFGSWGIDKILHSVRYLAKGENCKFVFIDHISIIVSAQESGDERRAIDEIMTKLRMLVQELDIHLGIVTHLKRISGTGHEEGSPVSLSHLRGSAGIGQLSDMVIGLERNSQHDDEVIRNTSTVRVLKNRFSGDTGPCAYLLYDRADTGRIFETERPDNNDDGDFSVIRTENERQDVETLDADSDVFDNEFITR